MTNVATNTKNDIYTTPDGSLAMVYDLADTQQACEHAMKAQFGEIVLALQRGVPTEATVWAKWKPLQFEAAARALLLTVPNVQAVKSFVITRSAGVATYVVVIQTAFGNTQVTGSFVQ